MSKQIRKLPIDTQFDYDKLIDMKADQLDDMVKECEVNIERLRTDIIKNYQMAQPYLTQMRISKQQLKKVLEKMEATKTFLSMEKNGSLVSGIDSVELKKSFAEPEAEAEQEPEPEPERPSSRSKEIAPKTPTKFKSQLVTNWVNKNKEIPARPNVKKPTNVRKS